MEKFGKGGPFYKNAFNKFSNYDLMNFFKVHGLELKELEEGRVFPVTEKSKSVWDVLKKVLDECGVKIIYNYRLKHIYKQSEIFELFSTDNQLITARKVIISTGGASYGFTGSTGYGFTIAESLGHQITELKPGGIPLLVREKLVPELKGITLDDVRLNIQYGGKIMPLPPGEILFTDSSISGPVIIDMSRTILDIKEEYGDLKLFIDFIPQIKSEVLEIRFKEDFQDHSEVSLGNYLKNYLPQSAIDPILKFISFDPQEKLGQITEKERLQLQETLKTLPLTITGHLPLDRALITCGGVSKKQIDPGTMESKLVKGIYFAGEIISGCGRRGGYNLQQAFSTGYVAGNHASKD